MRLSPIISILLALVIYGCKSARISATNEEGLYSAKAGVANQLDQESASVKNDVRDSLSHLMPQELSDLPTDSSSLARNAVGIINDQVDLDYEVTEHVKQLQSLQIDSTLIRKASNHGIQQANQYLREEYGMSEELPTEIDSTTYRQAQEYAKQEARIYLREQTGQEVALDSLSKQQLLTQSEELLEQQLKESDYFQDLEEALGNHQNIINEQNALIEAEQARMADYMNQKALKEKMTSAAKDFIQEHASEIQSVQSEMNEMKQVYSNVPDSEDLSSAVKQTSLEEEPFGKRLVFGGNFNIGKTDPFSLDLAPLIGYRFNKLFTAGISGSYRIQFERDILQLSQGDETVYGYSVFLSHQVYRNFIGYLEGENKALSVQNESGRTTTWEKGLLTGIGRQFNFGHGKSIQILVLYNFLYQNDNELYNSPLMFKTGIQF